MTNRPLIYQNNALQEFKKPVLHHDKGKPMHCKWYLLQCEVCGRSFCRKRFKKNSYNQL